MSSNNLSSPEQDETFKEVEACRRLLNLPSNDVALLMKMTQRNGKPLPVGSHIERKVYAEIQKLTGANPLGISKLNDQEVLVKFEEKTPIVGVAICIEKIGHWDEIPVEVECVMAGKETLIKVVKEKEKARVCQMGIERKQELIQAEQQEFKGHLMELLDKSSEQVRVTEPPCPLGSGQEVPNVEG